MGFSFVWMQWVTFYETMCATWSSSNVEHLMHVHRYVHDETKRCRCCWWDERKTTATIQLKSHWCHWTGFGLAFRHRARWCNRRVPLTHFSERIECTCNPSELNWLRAAIIQMASFPLTLQRFKQPNDNRICSGTANFPWLFLLRPDKSRRKNQLYRFLWTHSDEVYSTHYIHYLQHSNEHFFLFAQRMRLS